MTKKRRRSKPRAGYRSEPEPSSVQALEEPEASTATTRTTGSRRRAGQIPPALGFLSRGTGDSPFPPIPISLGRGFMAVGSSAIVLVVAFVLEFALWAGLVALGLEGPPGRLVNLLALPPVSTYFDALNGVTIYGFGSSGFLSATIFIVVRSVVLALLTGLIVQALEGGGSPIVALFRGLRAVPTVLAAGILALSLMVIGSVILPALGPGLGFLGSVLTLVAALFFLVYAPVVAVREDRSVLDAIRRSGRAALMPGSRHLILCMLYIFLTLPILVAIAPGGSLLGVNPSIGMWSYALVATFIHLGFLGTFAYRWIEAEHAIPEEPLKLRRR